MRFGRNPEIDIDSIDFSLPDRPSGLPGIPSDSFRFHFGTTKWGHKHWYGSLYPANTNANDHVKEYIRHFIFLELAAASYGKLRSEHIRSWMETISNVPEFKVAPKFFQSITHIKRLLDCDRQTADFIRFYSLFESHLGPSILQLHENWGPENFPALQSYLDKLPQGFQTQVELRHPGWYHPDVFNTLTALLKQKGMGLILSDTNTRRDLLHMTLTTKTAYIHFIGNGNHATDRLRLENWRKKILQWKADGLDEAYFTVNQHFEETFSETVATARRVFSRSYIARSEKKGIKNSVKPVLFVYSVYNTLLLIR